MASTALVLSAAPGVSWADPPPLGSACTIEGTAGPDVLNGTSGSDVICGNGGDDTLKGLGGDDLILGGNGGDTIDGGSGDDDLRGGNGDDTLNGATGEDSVYGDDDDDDLLGGNDDDLLVGGLGEDDVRGNNGADRVFGRADADAVYGGDGDDVLRGGPGSDDHFGQVGDDTIYDRDGAGNVDHASCGDGTDVARVDFYDTVNADCERRRNLDREDPVAVDDAETVDEDDAATTVDVLANDTDLDEGPITIDSVTQPANGTVVITNGGDDLTYEPDPDYCNDGSPTDDFTYTLAPGGDTATVAMTVTCVADVPVAVDDSEAVDEDDPATTFDVLANDDDGGQTIVIDAVTQPANGTVVITNAGADLTYEPDPDYCNDPPGTASDDFTYTLDPGGDEATVAVTVTCVNDTPDAVDDTDAVGEDDGPTTIDVLSNDSDVEGDAFTINQVTQPTNGTVVITNAGADLTYEPDANYCNDGVTTDDFTYELTPGGDTATVAVTVTCVTDPATAADDVKTVAEDSGATTIDVLANDTQGDTGVISILSTSDPANGTVVITNAGADLTYEPDPNYCNDPPGTTPDTFTYTLTPDGDTATVSVKVTCVNDAPAAVADSFDAIGNTGLFVGTTRPSMQAGKEITGSILANDTDTDTPQADLVAEPVTNAPTTLGGSITIESDGNFTYHPGDADVDVTDTFTYRVCDSSPCNSGTDANATGTLSLPLTGQVWYVRNNEAAGGDGTSDTPFDTLAEAEAASGTGDTVFVFDGSNTTTNLDTGFAMNANERLIGESRPLSLDPDGGGPLVTSPLHPGTSGAQPTLTASNEDVVVLASNVLVDGVDLDPSGTGGGISGGAGVDAVTVQNVNVTETGTAGTQPGIEMDGTTGVNRFTGVTVTNGGSATAIGVRINNADRVLFANTATNTIATSGAKALDVATTNLLTSRWNTITVTGSGTGAVRLSATTGQPVLGDGVGADLSLQTTSGSTAALDIASSNTVSVDSAGTDTVSATGGPALDIRNSNGSQFFFDSASSTNSAGDGVNLDANLTSPVVIDTGAISGATGIAFDVNGGGMGGGGVVFDGAINDGLGQSVEVTGRDGGEVTFSGNIADGGDVGGGIVVSSNSAGSTTFSGASKVLNTGASNAVSMTVSDGHTLSFTSGGLDIDTTSGRGFNADGSGTVVVSGSANTIDSTTARALSVVTTDIGAADLTFQRISANGASQGIVLDTTGTAGNLVVTGSGGTCTIADTSGCSGGTIANSSGADDAGQTPAGTAILLRNTTAPSFTRVRINNATNYGIRGTNVNGLTLTDSVVHGTIGTSALTANKDGGLRFEELTGTVNVTNTAVSGGYFTNVMVDNTAGALNATFDNVDSLSLDDTGGDDAVQFEGIGTADMNVVYKNSQVTDASGDLFQYIGDGTGGGDLDLTGNTFTNDEPSISTGGGGIALIAGARGAATMDVLNNTMRDSLTNALTIIKSRDVAAGTNNLVATIDNNNIGVAGDANSGSFEGDGMEITSFGDGNATFHVTNNDIRQYNSAGIDFIAGGGVVESGQVNINVSGNSIGNPGTNPLITLLQGIRVSSGVAAGDSFATCVDYGPNSILGSGGVPGDNRDFRFFAFQSGIRQPGYAGGPTDDAAFVAYAASRIGGGVQGTAVRNGGQTWSGTGTACP